MLSSNTYLIGISGGSCSGKTFLTNKLLKKYGPNKISIISLDSYYFDLSMLNMSEREKNNFDHPASFDFKQLETDLKKLKHNNQIKIPQYDFKTHTRKKVTKKINPTEIILIEGILTLYQKEIRKLLNLKIFLNISDKLRKEVRLKRDEAQRARTKTSILSQYKDTVEPMYTKYVQPTSKFADVIIKDNSYFNNGFNILSKQINLILEKDANTKK